MPVQAVRSRPWFRAHSQASSSSVRSRMADRGSGISFTEFSYMLLQGYDFYHGCPTKRPS